MEKKKMEALKIKINQLFTLYERERITENETIDKIRRFTELTLENIERTRELTIELEENQKYEMELIEELKHLENTIV